MEVKCHTVALIINLQEAIGVHKMAAGLTAYDVTGTHVLGVPFPHACSRDRSLWQAKTDWSSRSIPPGTGQSLGSAANMGQISFDSPNDD